MGGRPSKVWTEVDLFLAVEADDALQVELFIVQGGFDPNCRSAEGRTPLMLVCVLCFSLVFFGLPSETCHRQQAGV
jgi:hypothetical protein